MNIYKERQSKLIDQIKAKGLDGIFVTNLTNVRYLTGFTGSSGACLIVRDDAHFFSDTRYDVQSKKEVKVGKIHMIKGSYVGSIKETQLLSSVKRLAIESQHITLQYFQNLEKCFSHIKWIMTENLIEEIAAVKDESEIESLKEAVAITDRVFDKIIKEISCEKTEKEVAARISYLMKQEGACGDSYDPIIASGPNSALPHAKPTDKKFQDGDFVVMDFGALYQGYHADMTRTIVIGKATEKHEEIYNIVKEAQRRGIEKAKSGIQIKEVDIACREYITEKGYGKEFCHSTGHGIGLEVHTYPGIYASNTNALLENYVITIEPGIYIPNFGGVRIEDDCLILKDGCEPLNRSPKELIQINS